MKRKTTFIFAGIMSAVIGNNAYATGENTVTSKSYVDSTFQTKIPAKTITELAGDPVQINLVSTTNVPGQVGQVAIYGANYDGEPGEFSETEWADIFGNYNNYLAADAAVPSLAEMRIENADLESMINHRQIAIPQSGVYSSVGADGSDAGGGTISETAWLADFIKGTGLVTKTSEDGNVGERKIFEATDVSGYHAQALTQTEKDIQDISIPTVGAMMSALSNGITKITWGATETTAVQNYSTTFDGTTNNWPAADNGKLVDGTGLATALAEKQNKIAAGTAGNIVTYSGTAGTVGSVATYTGAAAYNSTNDSAKIPTMAGVATYAQAKMTCAGWPESVAVADRTDENCWLWYKN